MATTPGNYGFTLSNGGTTYAASIRITALTVKDHFTVPDAFVGHGYSYALTALNNVGAPAWTAGAPSGASCFSNAWPAWLSVNPSTGVLSGSPSGPAFYNLNVALNDGVDTICRNFNLASYAITVSNPGPAPGVLPDAPQNTGYSQQLTATGGTGTYHFTANSLPSGLTLDDGGLLHGPVNLSAGRYTFNVTATDTNAVSRIQPMSLRVVALPATLPSVGAQGFGNRWDDCTIGWPCSRGVSAFSGGAAPLVWSATGLPDGLSIRSGFGTTTPGYQPGDAEVWGVASVAGDYPITVTVTDFYGLQATNTFTLHVSELLQTEGPSGGFLGDAYSQRLRVIGGTPAAGASAYSVLLTSGQLPLGLAYTPGAFDGHQFVTGTPLENGNFSTEFTFMDAGGHSLRVGNFQFIGSHTATMNINSNYDLGTITQNVSYSNQLQACCPSGPSWTIDSGSLPSGLALSSSGLLSGTPTASGTFLFMARAYDGPNPPNYAVRQFKLVVTPLSFSGSLTVPALSSSGSTTLPYGNVNTPYPTVGGPGVSLSPGVIGGGAPSFALASGSYLPPGLALSVGGTISGTPTAGGQFSFTLAISSAGIPALLKSFSVSIYPNGVNPPLNFSFGPSLGPFTVGQQTFQLSGANGGNPPYHFSLTSGATTDSFGMRVQDGQPLPTFFSALAGYIGVVTAPGAYPSSIRVTDTLSNTFDRAFTLTVSSLAILSQTSPPKGTVGDAYAFTLTPYGGSSAYGFSLSSGSSLPAGLLMDSSGHITGIPTAPTSASPPSTQITLTDLNNLQDHITVGFTLVVNPYAITNGGVLPRGTVNVSYAAVQLLMSGSGCGAPCTWSVVSGSLPGGIQLTSAGVVQSPAGVTPTGTSNGSFTVQVSGTNGTVQKVFALQVVSASPQALSVSTSASLGYTTVGNSVSTSLSAQGGAPVYAWSLVSGSLPPGVSLLGPGETLSSTLAPGFSYLAGRPQVPGTYNFTLRVTDSAPTQVDQAFTWIISELSFQYTNLPLSGTTLKYNVAYHQPLLVMGGNSHYSWVNLDPLPPGLTLDPVTGVLDGTPSNTGSFSARIQVTDNAVPAHVTVNTVNFSIGGPTATLVNFGASANLGTISQGFGFTRDLSPSEFGYAGAFTISVVPPSTLPPGFAIETGNQIFANVSGSYILAGTPLAAGPFTFTLQAADTNGNIGVRTFTLNVSPVTIFTSGLTQNPTNSLPDGSLLQAYSQPLTAWNNGGTTNWAVAAGSSLPPGLTLTSAGLLGGAPTSVGNFSFTVNATDTSTGLVVSGGFSLRVSGMTISESPILPGATVGVPYTHQILVSGGNPSKSWSAPQGLPNGFNLSVGGIVTGTPNGASASTFVVNVTDGSTTLSRRFTLYSGFSNSGLVSFSQLGTVLPDGVVGQNYSATLSAVLGVQPYLWSVAPLSSLPSGLNLMPVSSLGNPIPTNFTPGTTLIAGAPTTPGTYSFDLLLADSTPGGTTVRRTFTLHIASITLLSGTLKTITAGASYFQQLTAVGGTAPYTFSVTPLNASLDTLPPGITIDASGPTAGLLHGLTTSTGAYGFTVHVVDSVGQTFARNFSFTVATSDTLRVNVTNPSDRPVGSNNGGSFFLFAGNSSGIGGPFTWSVLDPGNLPPGVHLTGSSLDGVASVPGKYMFTVRATDATAHTADRLMTIRVGAQLVSPPVQLGGQLPFAEIGASFTTTLKAAGGVAPYTFTASPFSPLPPWLTLTLGGVLAGTPPPQSGGSYVMQFVITDAVGKAVSTGALPLVVVAPGSGPALVSIPSDTFVSPGSIGVPFNVPLDGNAMQFLFRGGKAPFSWSVTGGSLPAGVILLPGNNGQPTYLGGTPMAAGDFPVTLTVQDALGQSLAIPTDIFISDLTVTPDSLGPPIVGTPYSVTFTPAGGTGPYSFELPSDSDVVPGLALSSDGVLSGTPTYAGNFGILIQMTDSMSRQLYRVYRVTVDSAAGEAPALVVAPTTVQVNYILGSPAPASVPLLISTTSGTPAFTAGVMGIPGGSLSPNAGTAPGSPSLNINVAGLVVGTYVGIIGAKASPSANVIDSVPVILTVQPAPACSYSLSPPSGSALNTGGAGNFSVSTGSLCSWTAVPSDPWITVTFGGSGTGSGGINYTVAANAGVNPRSGSISVNGQLYAITQFGTTCSFAINPPVFSATSLGGSALISITASNASCTWTASGLGATPPGGTGSGSVTVTVPANVSAADRVLTASIAVQTLTVNQAGTACSVGLDTYSANSPAGGGSGNVGVVVPNGCGYSTVLGPSWISVNSGGTGTDSGTLVYSVDPNSTITPRSGTLTIGGQVLHIAQDGLACSVTLDTSGLGSPFGSTGGSGTINITTNAAGCGWTASSAQPWASVVPPSGTGSGPVFVTVGANGTLAARATTLTIGGQSVGLAQSELACTFNLLSASGSVPSSGGSGSAGVSAPAACGWTAVTNTPLWLSVSPPGAGTGAGEAQFVASPNLSSSPRTGSLTIAGQTYTVNQAGAPCAYTLSAPGVTVTFGGTIAASFGVTTATGGCSPTAVSYASWITVSTSFVGTSGTVTYTVAPNPSTVSRAGAVQVGNQIFTVTELGGTCGWSLNTYGALFNSGGGAGVVLGAPSAPSCPLVVGADLPFVTLGSQTGPALSIFTQNYSVSAFSSLTIAVRYAHISFGGQVFTIKETSW